MCHRRLHELLEIPEDTTELQMHKRIVAGCPARLLMDLCEQGDVPASVSDWVVSPRRLNRRVREEQRLTADESDKLFRAVGVIAMVQALFGNKEKAKRWLSKPKARFAGEAPFAMLTTTPGVCAVEEMLLQVAEGVFA